PPRGPGTGRRGEAVAVGAGAVQPLQGRGPRRAVLRGVRGLHQRPRVPWRAGLPPLQGHGEPARHLPPPPRGGPMILACRACEWDWESDAYGAVCEVCGAPGAPGTAFLRVPRPRFGPHRDSSLMSREEAASLAEQDAEENAA